MLAFHESAHGIFQSVRAPLLCDEPEAGVSSEWGQGSGEGPGLGVGCLQNRMCPRMLRLPPPPTWDSGGCSEDCGVVLVHTVVGAVQVEEGRGMLLVCKLWTIPRRYLAVVLQTGEASGLSGACTGPVRDLRLG